MSTWRRAPLLVALASMAPACGPPKIMSARKIPDSGMTAELDGSADDQPRDASQRDSFFVVKPIDARYDVLQQQVYCPGNSKDTAPVPASCAALGVVMDPLYADHYTCFDLGPVPGVPPRSTAA